MSFPRPLRPFRICLRPQLCPSWHPHSSPSRAVLHPVPTIPHTSDGKENRVFYSTPRRRPKRAPSAARIQDNRMMLQIFTEDCRFTSRVTHPPDEHLAYLETNFPLICGYAKRSGHLPSYLSLKKCYEVSGKLLQAAYTVPPSAQAIRSISKGTSVDPQRMCACMQQGLRENLYM